MAETPDPVERSESLPVPGLPADWHVLATNKIVSTVDTVKVKTSGPAIKVSRMAVFGLMGALIGIVGLLMLTMFLVRALSALPGGIWIVYMGLGAVFMVLGALAWNQRPRGAAS